MFPSADHLKSPRELAFYNKIRKFGRKVLEASDKVAVPAEDHLRRSAKAGWHKYENIADTTEEKLRKARFAGKTAVKSAVKGVNKTRNLASKFKKADPEASPVVATTVTPPTSGEATTTPTESRWDEIIRLNHEYGGTGAKGAFWRGDDGNLYRIVGLSGTRNDGAIVEAINSEGKSKGHRLYPLARVIDAVNDPELHDLNWS
jgi:hypothetical protein